MLNNTRAYSSPVACNTSVSLGLLCCTYYVMTQSQSDHPDVLVSKLGSGPWRCSHDAHVQPPANEVPPIDGRARQLLSTRPPHLPRRPTSEVEGAPVKEPRNRQALLCD